MILSVVLALRQMEVLITSTCHLMVIQILALLARSQCVAYAISNVRVKLFVFNAIAQIHWIALRDVPMLP